MQILQNRRVAVLGMVILILVACLLGPGKYLKKSYTAATECFREDIIPDVENMVTNAGRLVSVASRYSDASNEAKKVDDIVSDANKAIAKNDAAALCEAASDLTEAVENLSAKLSTCALSEQDEKYNNGYLADVRSSEQILERIANGGLSDDGTGYNTLAEAYNEKRSAFPGSIFAGIVGYGTLPLYA